MSETLKLETNVPVEIAFKFSTGRECESSYSGTQKMYTLTDGRALYLSVAAGDRVEQQLREHGIIAGEFFQLCKKEVRTGNKKAIEYRVSPLASTEASVPPLAPAVPATTGPHPNGHSNGTSPSPNGHGAALAPLPGERPQSSLESALITAVAACYAAQRYAKSIGYEAMPQFTSEDIRTMANTIVIQQRQNGGGR